MNFKDIFQKKRVTLHSRIIGRRGHPPTTKPPSKEKSAKLLHNLNQGGYYDEF